MINKKPILRFGSGFETPEFKKDVQELQTLLKQGGFLPENTPIDGLFDQQTETAVKLFQNSKNLESDGVVGFQTWTYLESLFEPNSDLINNANNLDYTNTFIQISPKQNQPSQHPMLKLGDGINTPELQDQVKYLQELLKDNHFLEQTSLTDGLFWRKTESAVIEFQKSRNLLANGIVDEETWHSLETQVIQATLEKDQIQVTPINVNFNQENMINFNHIEETEATEKNPTLMMGDGLNTPHLQTAVKTLQELLQKQELLDQNFVLDGFFWLETETAIKTFQKNHNLEETGIVNQEIWQLLESKVTTKNLDKQVEETEQKLDEQVEETEHNLTNITNNNFPEIEQSVETVIQEKTIINTEEIDTKEITNLNKIEETKVITIIDPPANISYSNLTIGDGLNTPELQEEVKYLQKLLQNQGFFPEDFCVDGLFWQETETAVKAFQKQKNLPETGMVNTATWLALETKAHQELILSKDQVQTNQFAFQSQFLTLENLENLENLESLESLENINQTISETNENSSQLITEIQELTSKDHFTLKLGAGIDTPELQEEVKYLQTLLQEWGILDLNLEVNGLFWRETEEAVKKFQEKNNLTVDGIVNQNTWQVLEGLTSISQNSDQSILPENLTENLTENPPIQIEDQENLETLKPTELSLGISSENQEITIINTQEINQENTPQIMSFNLPSSKKYADLKLGDGIYNESLKEEVKHLQTLLKQHHFLPEDALIDGLFWHQTENAVKEFQKSQNLVADRIVTNLTWNALEKIQSSKSFSQPKTMNTNSNQTKTNYPILKIGDGMNNPQLQPDIKRLQTLLQKHQFLPENETIDGLFWRETEQAVKAFQKSQNLVADGVVADKTWKALEKEPLNISGASQVKKNPILKLRDGIDTPHLTEAVKQLQNLLKKWNFLHQNTVADGLFWKSTEEAVKAFQKSQNLVADGVVGEKTWQLLEQNPPIISPAKVNLNTNINPNQTVTNMINKYPVLKLRDGIDTPHLIEAVKRLQTLLKKWKFLPENIMIDGLFGKNTEGAVRAFQKSNNLTVDGVVGAKTWELLEKNPPTINPSKPTIINSNQIKESVLKLRDGVDTPHLIPAVKELQTLLKKWKFLAETSPIDGLFLQITENAVKAFQKSKNLLVDGVVGEKTWSLLKQNPPVINPPKTENKPPTKPPVVVNKYPVLKLGDGIKTPELIDVVKKLQVMLKTYHFLPENMPIDGLFGEETEKAVKLFQQTQNLTPDGVIGENTWKFLESLIDGKAIVRPVLKFKDGIDFPDLINEVKSLQNLLIQRNLINIVDGLFGKDTENAVKTFQKNNNLTADGIVGKETWSLLSNQTINTYIPLRKFSNVNLVNQLIGVISNSTIKRYASQSIPLILQEAQKYNITDQGQIAYILATAQHESRLGQWMVEFASGQAYEGRMDLGNTQPGDGARYKGRGFVQITGRRNYTDWSQRLGIDLVNNPQKATDFAIAAKILVLGMRDGTFTSRRLSQYVNDSMRDFYNARRVINGLDQATHIAGLAENFLKVMS